MRKHTKRRLVSEINIVPYVDVMLVLLVIFMVTAPLLTQGVQVDLPQAKAEPLPQDQKPPLVVSVDASGHLFLDQSKESIQPEDLAVKIAASIQVDPTRAVLVRGDKNVDYGKVMNAMVLLKRAGVSKVGLMTEHTEE
ncbi:MAG: protein TolR [Gammaproteobacteria bacterium]|jgi:biopolymer transport protein TolR|nr:protein TolR [Gammaproteobacteria bacterium]